MLASIRVVALGILCMALAAAGCSSGGKELPARACGRPPGVTTVQVNPKQSVDPGTLQAIARQLLQRARTTLDKAEVCLKGRGIEVRLNEDANTRRAETLLGARGRLEFRPVKNGVPAQSTEWARTPSCAEDPETIPERTAGKIFCVRGVGPDGIPLPGTQWSKLELAEPALGNVDITAADAVLEVRTGRWIISLRLTPAGGAKFASITGILACNKPMGAATRQIAIVVDGIVESHPQVGEDVACQQGIQAGMAQITGNFSEESAKDLAAILTAGVLPADVELG